MHYVHIEIERLRDYIGELESKIEELKADNDAANEEIEELKAKLVDELERALDAT